MADTESIKNLVQSPNNPNIWFDNQKEERVEDEAVRRAESTELDPEPTGYALYRCLFEEAIYVPIVDPHIGGEGSNATRLKMVVHFIEVLPNAFSAIIGDAVDNGNSGSKTNYNTSKIRPNLQVKAAVKILWPIKDKIVVINGGNHDSSTGERNKVSDWDLSEQIANQLKVKYHLYNTLLETKLKTTVNKKRVVENSVFIYQNHGSGVASSGAGSVDMGMKNCSNGLSNSDFANIKIDVMIIGHTHADSSGEYTVKVIFYDKNGLAIGESTQNIKMISSPSMQGPNSYSTTNNMPSTNPNANAIHLCCVAVADESEKGYHFEVRVTTYKVLKENSNEYTEQAKETMRVYGLDKKAIEKEIDASLSNNPVISEDIKKLSSDVTEKILGE